MKFITRSLLILLALYGVVFAIGDAFLAHARASVWLALVFALGFAGLQYLIAPWIITRILEIRWVGEEFPLASKALAKTRPLNLSPVVNAGDLRQVAELPRANSNFVERLCAERRIRVPKIGLILSGTPNAFSFGRVRSDACGCDYGITGSPDARRDQRCVGA